MLFIDIIILTVLATLWPHLKRRIHLHDHWVREMLAILWGRLKCRMHRHGRSSRLAPSTISDGRRR